MHLTESDIALFVEGISAENDRRRIEHHLAQCASCVEQVAALVKLRDVPEVPLRLDEATVQRAERFGKRSSLLSFLLTDHGAPFVRYAFVSMLIVAGIAIPYFLFFSGDDSRQFRSPDVASPVPMMSPADGAGVSVADLVFRWSSVAGSLTYRFTLSELSGKELWSTTLRDTSVVLPPFIAIHAGNRYLWRVEVVFRDNTRYRSSIHVVEVFE
jgi:hypothetical protein